MDACCRVATVGAEALDEAFSLLHRFFVEEGFSTPVAEMRKNLSLMLADETSALFLAWRDGSAVGVATVTTGVGIELGMNAELEDLYVLPSERGKGIAASLIEAVRAWSSQRGCRVISVVVTSEAQAAHDLIAFYRRHGFSPSGRTLLYSNLAPD